MTVLDGRVRRIHIIGGPGSGKSTLARTLAAELNLPLDELDRVAAYRPPAGMPDAPFRQWDKVPDSERLRWAEDAASQDAWVAEGIYTGWTESLSAAADLIIWLDTPPNVAGWRVLHRYLGARRRGDDVYRGLRATLRLARNARNGYSSRPFATAEQLAERDSANSPLNVADVLARHPRSGRRCRRTSDMNRLLRELDSHSPSTRRRVPSR